MKISVPRQDPLSLPHGAQPAKYACRQFSNVTCSVLEPLECPREKHQLCWSRFGPGSSTDCFPPDNDIMPSFISNDTFLTKEKLNGVQPPLNSGNMASENDQQLHHLAQATTTSFQGQRQDRTEVVQDYTIVGDADTAGDTYVDPRHSPSLSDEEDWSRSSVLVCDQSADGAYEAASNPLVKLMCSFGGKIMARPVDGKLRYVGGETRIVSICKGVSFTQFMSKMSQVYGSSLGLKYQLPDEELDALISVSSDDDLQNMMEEYDKVVCSGVAGSRLRLFFFTASADVEITESKTEGDNCVPRPDQRYVDAINGLAANYQANLPEEDTAVPYPFVTVDSTDACGRASHLEHGSEMPQVSAPSSSLPSPIASGQAIFQKPPGLQDLSLQIVNRDLSKPSSVPFGFEEETGQDALDNSLRMPFHYHYDPSHVDLKFSQSMDSPRISVREGLNRRNDENWHGLRLSDSQSKVTHLPDLHNEFRSSLGLPLEHWQEATYMRDMSSPQGDYQHASQQYTGSLPSLQQSYHSAPRARYQHEHQYHQFHQHQPQQQYQPQQQQQQQHQHQHQHGHRQHPSHQHRHSWFPHNEGDPGRCEYPHQEVPNQLHLHQLPYHRVHNAPVHDGCSLNSEHHGTSRSTQLSTHMLLGLAPPLPYKMGSTPSSPRHGVHDYQGKCPCGLQHSQVHRGITVSIGEQPYTRWLPSKGDQAVRKQALRSSSRCFNDGAYGADAASWQQANHSMLIGEGEHKDFANHWPFSHGRHSRDSQIADSLARNRNVHYAEPLNYNGGILPSHDRTETSMRCLCAHCEDNRRQQVEAAKGHSTNMEVSDHASDWPLPWKGFDVDHGTVASGQQIFPRASVLKDGEQNTVDEKVLEVGSGFCVSPLTGGLNSSMPVAAHIDHSRKVQLSSDAVFGTFVVSDEPMLPLPAIEADRPLKLTKSRSELTISRSNAPSEPRFYHDVLSRQQGQQMQLEKDFQAMVVVGSSSGAEKLKNNIAFSEANNVPAMSISLCRDQVYSDAGRALSDAVQHYSLNCGPSSGDEGSSSVSLAGGDLHQSSPDVIPLSSVVEIHTSEEMSTSPVFDHSPSSSIDMMNFSFAAGKPLVSPPERILDKEAFALGMSAHGELADSMASSVLDCYSNETVWKVLDAGSKEEEENITKAKEGTKKVSREGNVVEVQLGEDYGGGLAKIKDKLLEDGMEAVMDKAGATKGLLEASTMDNSRVTLVGLSDESNKEEAASAEKNEHSISEAEAEATARGLQIIINSDLEDMKELGSGTYGTVYHGKWRGSDVAIKRIKASCFTGSPSDRERLITDFWREACLLGQLHHPNVVAFYGMVPDGPGGTLATVTEYMVNGSLKQVLSKKDRTIDRRKRLFIAMDAAFGMEYLHSKNIVHFDLKCENLLVNMRDVHRPICKVGDFGLSKVKHHTLVSCGVRGTLPWMAPELLTGNSGMVSEKVDVFSFGIVMWELLTGEEPYANMHCGAIIGGIANNTLRPSIPSWCDPAWRSLMERCWVGNPVERPAFTEVAKELRAIAATMNLK